jgi:hypothetical protein
VAVVVAGMAVGVIVVVAGQVVVQRQGWVEAAATDRNFNNALLALR